MVNEDFLLQLEVSIVSANHKSDAILPFIDLDFKPGLSIAPRSNVSHKKAPSLQWRRGFWLGKRDEVGQLFLFLILFPCRFFLGHLKQLFSPVGMDDEPLIFVMTDENLSEDIDASNLGPDSRKHEVGHVALHIR